MSAVPSNGHGDLRESFGWVAAAAGSVRNGWDVPIGSLHGTRLLEGRLWFSEPEWHRLGERGGGCLLHPRCGVHGDKVVAGAGIGTMHKNFY